MGVRLTLMGRKAVSGLEGELSVETPADLPERQSSAARLVAYAGFVLLGDHFHALSRLFEKTRRSVVYFGLRQLAELHHLLVQQGFKIGKEHLPFRPLC